MGYGDLHEGSEQAFTPEGSDQGCMNGAAIFKFSWQTRWGKTHGFKPAQVLLGLPGGRYEWGGRTLPDHLKDAAAQGAGICIWDIPGSRGGPKDGRWGREESWSALKRFKDGT